MLFILFIILILNVVAIMLIYHFLPDIEKRDRIIFIGVGIAVIYMLTSLVYWISTKDIKIEEVSEIGKNIIIFMFVPINSIAVLPIIAKSYNKYRIGSLATDKLRNRVIAIAIPLFIILIIECVYFKNIQNNVIKLVQQNTTNTKQEIQTNEISNQQGLETNSISDQQNVQANATSDQQNVQINSTNEQ